MRNRFFIGEVVYRGAAHRGEQEPIVDRALFDAVQEKLAASANARQLKLRTSPSILTGRIFDDCGNRMTPTHTNKQGARYRYYISHAVLQKRTDEAGSVPRVPGHDVEILVVKALRDRLGNGGEHQNQIGDRELVEQQVERIIVKPQAIEIHLASKTGHEAGEHNRDDDIQSEAEVQPSSVLTILWTAIATAEVKGIVHSPSSKPAMSAENQDVLLTAIAKARAWIDDLAAGRAASFAEIASREGKVERHIRFLAPLAFVSPRIISAIAERSAPDLKVTDLAKALTCSWTEQEQWVECRMRRD